MSDTSGARACARARNAHVPWDSELPAELWLIVLRHLSLMQLQLLKTVSHSMAKRCRRVLCSSEWRDWIANEYAMEQEVATQAAKNYTLPLQVGFFEQESNGTAVHRALCFGTIHRLKLKLLSTSVDFPDPDSLVPSNWDWSNLSTIRHGGLNHNRYRIAVVDMLIEVNGRGLCGSEYALRRVLADVVDEAGAKTSVRAEEVCGANLVQYAHEDGSPDGGEIEDEEGNQMDLRDLLMHITPVTRVGTGLPISHRITHQNEQGRNRYYLDLLQICGSYPGVIT